MRIYSNNQIGDTLMQTPALRAWKKAHPSEKLIYCCGPIANSSVLLEHNPHIDELIPVQDEVAADCILRARDAFWLGFRARRQLSWGYGKLLGVEIDDLKYEYGIAPPEEAWARAKQVELGSKVVLVARHSTSCKSNNPARGNAQKCLPNGLWVELAHWLIENDYTPVAIGSGPESADTRYANWPGPSIYGENLRNIAALCRQAHAILTVDNGIRHLAAASGADVLCISLAIHLWQIRCVPVRKMQTISETFCPADQVSAEYLIRQTRTLFQQTANLDR